MFRLHLPSRVWPLALTALAGCHTPPPAEPASPAAPPPPAAAPAASPVIAPAPRQPALLDEQRRLAALFAGTPVVFAMQAGGVLRVDVPLRFSFDRGQTAVKPPLAAVLDRVAQSQHDGASRLQISASGDAPANPRPAASAASNATRARPTAPATLAARRAASMRDRLASQGIAVERMTVVDAAAAGVRLLVTEPPPP